jgi:hypothetical protein
MRSFNFIPILGKKPTQQRAKVKVIVDDKDFFAHSNGVDVCEITQI